MKPTRFLTLRFATDRGRAISRARPGKHACPIARGRAFILDLPTYFCAVVSLVDCSAGSFADCPRGRSKRQYQGGLVEKDADSSKSVTPGRRPHFRTIETLVLRVLLSLRRVLTLYSLYYNETRTHLGLSKDAPLRRAVQRTGMFDHFI
jgi:hypothetical protein